MMHKDDLMMQQRWVCMVVRSGYHNSAYCSPEEPHYGWGCCARIEFSMPATNITRLLADEWNAIVERAAAKAEVPT